MSKKNSTNNHTTTELNAEQINPLYSILGQVLDGIWFLETESLVGFEKALAIDLAVWKRFAANETRRILAALVPNPDQIIQYPPTEILKLVAQILKISLFNQSIEYEIEYLENESALLFKVMTCKTLKGMAKVGRPLNQAQRICKDIGLAYYENMVKTVHPDLKAECVSIPDSYTLPENTPRCVWKLSFKP